MSSKPGGFAQAGIGTPAYDGSTRKARSEEKIPPSIRPIDPGRP